MKTNEELIAHARELTFADDSLLSRLADALEKADEELMQIEKMTQTRQPSERAINEPRELSDAARLCETAFPKKSLLEMRLKLSGHPLMSHMSGCQRCDEIAERDNKAFAAKVDLYKLIPYILPFLFKEVARLKQSVVWFWKDRDIQRHHRQVAELALRNCIDHKITVLVREADDWLKAAEEQLKAVRG